MNERVAILPPDTADQFWHVEGREATGKLIYSATVKAEIETNISGASVAIEYACDRLAANNINPLIVTTWSASRHCPNITKARQ